MDQIFIFDLTPKQGHMDCQVGGPTSSRGLRFCLVLVWSGPVRDFQNFVGTASVQCKILKISCSSPIFSNFYSFWSGPRSWSWSGPRYSNFGSGQGYFWFLMFQNHSSKSVQNFWFLSVLFRSKSVQVVFDPWILAQKVNQNGPSRTVDQIRWANFGPQKVLLIFKIN